MEKLKKQACLLRQAVIAMLAAAGSGHPASSLGSAEIFTWLYQEKLKKKPQNPRWQERDYFLLSAGHLAPAWYAALVQAGYFKADLLPTLRKFGSPLQGHPERNLDLGIENTGGPLGQGISMATGLAYGLLQEKSSQKVFVLSTDGEQNEGQVWEAYLFASHYQLKNLTVLIDQNGIQQSGLTKEILNLGNLQAKLIAFGFTAVEANGHSFTSLDNAWQKIKKSPRPKAIICKTTPGKGVSFMENNYLYHAKKLSQKEALQAIEEIKKTC